MEQHQYDARVSENQPAGRAVVRVTARDPDSGVYGQLTYSIPSQLLLQTFSINNVTGLHLHLVVHQFIQTVGFLFVNVTNLL